MLCHLSYCSNYSVLRQVYFSVVESYIRHGISAWGSSTYCRTLQNTQNQLLKILTRNYHSNIIYNTPIETNNQHNNISLYATTENSTSLNHNGIANSIPLNYNGNTYHNTITANTAMRQIQNNNTYNVTFRNNNSPLSNNSLYTIQDNRTSYDQNSYSNTSNNTIVNYNVNTYHNSFSNNIIDESDLINNTNNIHNATYLRNNATNNSTQANYTSDTQYINITTNNITTRNNTNFVQNDSVNRAKILHLLNVKSIYYMTLINEFYRDSRFLKVIDHNHNTRRRQQGKFKVEKFRNEYGRNTLKVTLPTIFNKLPNNIINEKNEFKRKKLIKNYLISSQ